MNIQISGQITNIFQAEHKSDKFSKREIRVSADPSDKFASVFPLEAVKLGDRDDLSLLDDFKVGDWISARCSLHGREWQNPSTQDVRCFVSIRIESIQSDTNMSTSEVPFEAPSKTVEPPF